MSKGIVIGAALLVGVFSLPAVWSQLNKRSPSEVMAEVERADALCMMQEATKEERALIVGMANRTTDPWSAEARRAWNAVHRIGALCKVYEGRLDSRDQWPAMFADLKNAAGSSQ